MSDYEVYFGSSEITTSVTGIDFTREQNLGYGGSHTISTVKMTVRYTPILNSLFYSEEPIQVRIKKNSIDYFRGIIRPNISLNITHEPEFLELEVLDNSYKLEVPIAQEVVHVDGITAMGMVFCNSNIPNLSLIHRLLNALGFTGADYNITITDNTPVEYFKFEEGELGSDILEKACFEYGYSYYFNASGKLVLQRTVFDGTEVPLYTFNNTNIRQPLTINKKEVTHDGAVVEVEKLQYLGNQQLVYRAISNPDDRIMVAPGLYYPPAANTFFTFKHLADSENNKIMYSRNARVDAIVDPELTLDRWDVSTPGGCYIRYYNGSDQYVYIHKLDIRADIVKGEKVEYSTENGKNKEKYQARFYSFNRNDSLESGRVDKLLGILIAKQSLQQNLFTFSSKEGVPLGTLVNIEDSKTNIQTKAQITSRIDIDGDPLIYYQAVPIGPITIPTKEPIIKKLSSNIFSADLPDKLEELGDKVQSQGDSITGHTTTLAQYGNKLTSLQNQLNTLDSVGEGWEDFSQMVSDGATAIQTLTGEVDGLLADTAIALSKADSALSGVNSNSSSISTINSNVSTLSSALSTEQNRVSNLLGRVEAAEGSILDNTGDISGLLTRITSAEGTLDGHTTSITQNASGISTLAGRMTTAEGKITTQGSSISQNANAISSIVTDISSINDEIELLDTSITQNAGSITSLATRVTKTEGSIAGHTTSITQNANSITSLATRVSDTEEDVVDLGTAIIQNADDITSLATRVTSTEGTISNHTTSISQNAGNISSLASRVTSTEGSISKQSSLISQNANSITSMVSDISSINGDIADIEGDITDLVTSISQNANGITSLAARVTTNEGTLANQATSISQNASSITSLASDISTIDGEISGLATSITQNANNITTVAGRVSITESDISGLGSDLSSLTGRISSAESTLLGYGTSITQNADSITSLATRLTGAEGTLTQQGSSITQNANSITTLVGRLDSSEENISSALSSIAQNASNIALSVKAINSQGHYVENAKIEVGVVNEEGYLTLDADKILMSGSVKADKIDVDNLMTQELEVKNVLYSGYTKSGNAPLEGSGFWLSSTGKLKASNAELIGSIKSGNDAPGSSRISARDKAGISSGPAFYGTGNNDLDIAVEGGQDGGAWDVVVTRADVENTNFAINEGWWREAKPTSEYQYFRPNSVASRGNVIIVSGNYASWTRSTDGGRTWTPTQKLMYGGYAESYASQLRWDKVANNGGDTWIMMGSTSWENDSAAGTYITRSLDNGVTWSAPVKMAVHGAQGSCIAGKGNIWIIGGVDGYYYRSTDNGVSWSRDRRSTFRWTDVAYSGDTWLMVSESYLTGTPYKSTNNGSSWYHIGGSTLSSKDIGCLSVNGRGSVWIITASNGNIYRSTDDGETFSQTISGEHMFGRSAWIRYTAFYGSTWIVGDSYKVGYSTDNGSSWQLLPNQIPGTGCIWGLTSSNDEFLALYEYSTYRLQQSTDYIAIRKNSGNLGSEISLYPKRNITIATDTVIKFNDIIGHHAGDRWSFTKDDIASLKLADVNGNVYLTATNGILTVNNMKMNGGSVVGNVNVEGTPYRVWGAVAN